MKIISILEKDEYDFSQITKNEKYKKVVPKKVRYLLPAFDAANINNMFLLDFDEISDDDEILFEKMEKCFSGDYIEIKNETEIIRRNKKELVPFLKKVEQGSALLIREFIDTRYCGFAWYTNENNLYIEARRGGFYGYWLFTGIPTQYIVDKNDSIKYESIKENYYYDYDYNCDQWFKVEKKERAILDQQTIISISKIVRSINENKIRMKVAWALDVNNDITVLDVFTPVGVGIME